MNFLFTLLALNVVIFCHELGHMLLAKRVGVRVKEFSIGMGTSLFGKTIGDTLYSLRLLPVGGYVKLAGMDDADESVPDSENFNKKSVFDRFLVLVAGSIANVLLALVVFISLLYFFGTASSTSIIEQVRPDSPAALAGLKPNDHIVSVNGNAVTNVRHDLISIINNSAGVALELSIQQQGLSRQVTIIPETTDGKGLIGIQLKAEHIQYSLLRAIKGGFKEITFHTLLIFKTIDMLINGDIATKHLSGPVGIIQIASFQLQFGIASFLNIMAIISISLGIINLFPFPVLDGGHIFFLLVEFVRGKPLNRKLELMIHNLATACLITFFVFIVYNDIKFWPERVDILNGVMSPGE